MRNIHNLITNAFLKVQVFSALNYELTDDIRTKMAE